jgi:PAT family beta-lactamase induction signal transducer AmpG
MQSLKRALTDPKLLIVLLMGFSSGLPLVLVGGTLKAWLTETGLDLKTIGFFSLVSIPYSWKFVWSPIMDRYVPPLGRRRGWLMISQIGITLSLLVLSLFDPSTNIQMIAACAVVVAFFSASQDIVVDAYRREILPDEELGLGSSIYVFGYRIAMLVSNAGALMLAEYIAWPMVYWAMAAFMAVGIITTIYCKEPQVEAPPPRTLKDSVIGPLKDFFTRDKAWVILAFVVLYKVGESIASSMFNPFYLKLGFSKTEIATAAKLVGLWSVMLGGFVGGVLMVRLGTYRSLWIFGILQTLGLLFFSALAEIGNNIYALGAATGIENFTSGMATTAYVGFMAAQTNKRFTATQYALLSSLMAMSRDVMSSGAGIMAEQLGWSWFFIACMVCAVPGMLVLFFLKPLIKH